MLDPIIPRNSKIPTKAGRQYTTSVDGQVNLKIAVYQGERDLVSQNRKLGEFTLSGIPAMPAGLPKVDVNFLLNADGILQVEAIELRSNTRQQVEIKPQYGLTDEQVEQMLMDSLLNAKDDVAARLLIEARTAAEQLLYQVEQLHPEESASTSPTAELTRHRRRRCSRWYAPPWPAPERDPILQGNGRAGRADASPYAERVMNISIQAGDGGQENRVAGKAAGICWLQVFMFSMTPSSVSGSLLLPLFYGPWPACRCR
ncbi:MAG: Hsp70 family protein [Hymenobacter sp.]